MKVDCTLVSVQSGSPDMAFGQLAKVPFKTGTHRGLLRAAIPTDIPDTAVVTKAELVFMTRAAAWTGSRDFSFQPLSAGWRAAQVTWNSQPGVAGAVTTVTVGAVAEGSEFRVDVGTDGQAITAGTLRNHGWRMTTTDATLRYLFGALANNGAPWLDFEYAEYLEPPVNLSPNGGATSVAKPVLTFDVPDDDLVAVQVQIDAAADDVSPDWDSGEVAASGGMLALEDTDYPGLADGSTTFWRVRAKSSLGFKPTDDEGWSDWAELPRVSKPALTITGPDTTTGDANPIITADMTGMTAYIVRVYAMPSGKLLAKSRKEPDSTVVWEPPKLLKFVGDKVRIQVRAWDDVERTATAAAGDREYVEAEVVTELVKVGTADGVDSVYASLIGKSPAVRIVWDNTPTADKWQVTRDGEFIERLDGAENEYIDYGASPLQTHVYQVLPVTLVSGKYKVSPNGPTASVEVNLLGGGIWLIDPDTGREVVLYGRDEGSWAMDEQAVIHNVLGKPPVRRRSAVLPPSGSLSGQIYSVDDQLAEAYYQRLLNWKADDSSHVYRLVIGDWNVPVTLGDIIARPLPQAQQEDRMYTVSLNWWQTADELPWD